MTTSVVKDKIQAFDRILQAFIHHYELNGFQILKRLDWELSGVNECDFLKLYNEMCQHLEDLYKPTFSK